MKTTVIVKGLKRISESTKPLIKQYPDDGYDVDVEILDTASEFIKPYADYEKAIEEAKDALNLALSDAGRSFKEVGMTCDEAVLEAENIMKKVGIFLNDEEPEEETIITDISQRLDELDGLPQYELNLSGSREEDERISAYNESLKELANWYATYRSAVRWAEM